MLPLCIGLNLTRTRPQLLRSSSFFGLHMPLITGYYQSIPFCKASPQKSLRDFTIPPRIISPDFNNIVQTSITENLREEDIFSTRTSYLATVRQVTAVKHSSHNPTTSVKRQDSVTSASVQFLSLERWMCALHHCSSVSHRSGWTGWKLSVNLRRAPVTK